MHPQYHLDLHHDRARSLQRDAHQRRLRREAPRRPVHEGESSDWREALGMRLVRVGLRLAGSAELPATRFVAYRSRRRRPGRRGAGTP